MDKTVWKLRSLLEREGISAYALAKTIANDAQPNTVYRLVRSGKEPKRVDLNTLTIIIKGLRNMTGRKYAISDILEFQESQDND
ncbi:hypothetical protein [Deinococcus sp.]|uniref:hypothetical protein n=1 Tax=Deinococcus sp. TaxID=47478 RepID=UPI0025DE5FAE|nr:hypothetical protein [Deinococcus sp.]